MAERVPLGDLYEDARERVRELVLTALAADPARAQAPVPATPGWTVHDVVAHLVGVAEDLRDGKLTGPPTPEWTAGQVARGAGVPTRDLFAAWDDVTPPVLAVLERQPVWPLVLDVGAHEQDLRGALGVPGARDCALVRVGAKVLLSGIDSPVPLVVATEHHTVAVGGADRSHPEDAPLRLRTTEFEAFRWRLGRRSPAQLAAMDWDGDPSPLLTEPRRLCIFGPAAADLVE